jgi:hypothetical protein
VNAPNPFGNSNGDRFSSANAGAFGSAVAVVIVMTFHMRGTDFPAGYEAALACIISTACAYARALLIKVTGASLP